MAILTDTEYDEDLLMAVEDSPSTFVLHMPEVGSPSFNVSTGVASTPSDSEEVIGLIEEITSKEVEQGHGIFAYGDRLFFIRVADLTLVPTTRGWIVYGSITYRFIHVEKDPSERLWILVGREV